MSDRPVFQKHGHGLWRLDESALEGLTPLRARDLIVTCFFHAQKEAYAAAKGELGLPMDDEAVMKSVATTIRVAHRDLGGEWDRPTRADLTRLVELLAAKSATFGTPANIITHHRDQIMRMLDRLPA